LPFNGARKGDDTVIKRDAGRKNAGRAPKQAHPSQLAESIPDTAARLDISRTSVYELLRAGELESIKIGKSRRILIASTLQLVERLRSQAAA
jgi:excisionase family DNA binding protein